MVCRKLRFIRRQMSVQFRLQTLSGFSLMLLFIQPVLFGTIGFVLVRMRGDNNPGLIRPIIGGGLMGLWSSTLFGSFFDIVRDRADGTLELIVGSPTSLGVVLGARVLTNILSGLISLVISFLITAMLFRFSFSLEYSLSLLISLIILIFALWCLGVFLANFEACSRASVNLVNGLELPVAILSGFLFPVSVLPVWLQSLSAVLPTRWAVAALYGAAIGSADGPTVWRNWGLALGLSLFYLVLARRLMDMVHDKIRISGELSSI